MIGASKSFACITAPSVQLLLAVSPSPITVVHSRRTTAQLHSGIGPILADCSNHLNWTKRQLCSELAQGVHQCRRNPPFSLMIPRFLVPVFYAAVIVVSSLVIVVIHIRRMIWTVWQWTQHMHRSRAEACGYPVRWTSEWLETEELEAIIGRSMRLRKRRG